MNVFTGNRRQECRGAPAPRHPAAIFLCVLIFLLPPLSAARCAPREDGAFFPPPPRNHVTFWGHACCYIDVDGFGIVTDPVFAGRYFLRRRKIPIPPADSRAGTRLVLVSHAHMDHLDAETIALFPDSAVILCPWTVAERLEGSSRVVRVLRPGDVFDYPHGTIVAVRAEHPGKRFSWKGRQEDGAIGFIITTPYGTVYYSGDTSYFDGMNDIGAAWRPDIAIISITAHLKDENAVRAAWALRARIVIPVHFGAYDYFLFGFPRRPRGYDDIEEMIADQAILLQPGESVPLERETEQPRR